MHRMRPIDTVDGLGLPLVGAHWGVVRWQMYGIPGIGMRRAAAWETLVAPPDSDRIAGICLCGPRPPAIRPCSPGACHIGIDPGSLAFPISLPVHVEDDMKRLLVLLLCAPLLLFASTSK